MFGQVSYRMAEVKIDEKTLREMAEATGPLLPRHGQGEA